MQAARVVSGSLVTDIDMAGAPCLLPLSLPPSRPPPISVIRASPPLPSFSTPPPLSIYFLLFSRVSLTSPPPRSPPPHSRRVSFASHLALPALPPLTAHSPTSPPLSLHSWELLAPSSEERPLPGPVQDRTEQGGVLQHRPSEHLVDRGGRE